jgi:hypothetical protein
MVWKQTKKIKGNEAYSVDDFKPRSVLAIEPVTVVNPLSKELNWRLRAELLLLWHVQVVDEQDARFSHCWTVDSLSSSE